MRLCGGGQTGRNVAGARKGIGASCRLQKGTLHSGPFLTLHCMPASTRRSNGASTQGKNGREEWPPAPLPTAAVHCRVAAATPKGHVACSSQPPAPTASYTARSGPLRPRLTHQHQQGRSQGYGGMVELEFDVEGHREAHGFERGGAACCSRPLLRHRFSPTLHLTLPLSMRESTEERAYAHEPSVLASAQLAGPDHTCRAAHL